MSGTMKKTNVNSIPGMSSTYGMRRPARRLRSSPVVVSAANGQPPVISRKRSVIATSIASGRSAKV